jgi:hypothetical protein
VKDDDAVLDQDSRGEDRSADALKALAFIEAELAQLEHIPADTWNRLHAAFEKVRAAL